MPSTKPEIGEPIIGADGAHYKVKMITSKNPYGTPLYELEALD